MPHAMNPLKRIPFDRKVLAKAKKTEALSHCCLAQANMPKTIIRQFNEGL